MGCILRRLTLALQNVYFGDINEWYCPLMLLSYYRPFFVVIVGHVRMYIYICIAHMINVVICRAVLYIYVTPLFC